MFGISKGKQVKKVQSEISALEARRAQLQKLHAQALADEATAQSNLEQFLDRGDLSEGLNGAQTAAHFAKQNSLDLAAAIQRQEGVIAAAQERLAQAYDREAREKAAAAREKAAEAVEEAAEELHCAVEAVAVAFDQLCDAIPHGALDIRGVAEARVYWGWQGRPPDERLNAVEIARAVTAEALYERAPELFEIIARNSDVLVHLPLLTRRAGRVARGIQREDVEFGDAVTSAKAFVADPLRALAEDIRSGAVPVDHPASLALPPPPPPEPTVSMLMLRAAYWREEVERSLNFAINPWNETAWVVTMAVNNWYGTQRWKRMRRAQLQREPLCAFCMKQGKLTAASVADHVEPHRGNEQMFWHGELRSLCQFCHSGTKQQQETRGYATDIGRDGWPICELHPANKLGKR
jgi:5-methylcytosine-specific restriction enzyme A